jgi:hypothetical protein
MGPFLPTHGDIKMQTNANRFALGLHTSSSASRCIPSDQGLPISSEDIVRRLCRGAEKARERLHVQYCIAV